jgi:hypothetical protein
VESRGKAPGQGVGERSPRKLKVFNILHTKFGHNSVTF